MQLSAQKSENMAKDGEGLEAWIFQTALSQEIITKEECPIRVDWY